MAAGPDRFIIDGTLGGGGHSERFLEAGAGVLGIDRDPEALALIGTLYRHEQIIRERQLTGERKLAHRTAHSEPVLNTFWQWCDF